MSISDGRP